MSDLPPSFFFNAFLFLLIPFLAGLLLRRFRIPPIIGYIVGGIILTNLFGTLLNEQVINTIAYSGIVLLLFTLGLEINFEKVIALKRFIIIGGILQVFLSAGVIFAISLLFQFTFLQALLIGFAFTSSSTALIAKIIQDRGEESSFLGELTLGILMFQDLAFIPIIILFTTLGQAQQSAFEVVKSIGYALFESAVILCAIYYFGKKFVPVVFDMVAKTSRELLNLLIIVFIFFIALIASLFHIPILIATFIAGVLVSQTVEHYHVFSQIRPLRDILAIIFFVFIGTNIKLASVVFALPQILLFTFLIILAKAIILLGIFLYLRFSSRLAFSLAIFLFQISENAFIVLSLAYLNKVFTSDQYLFVITSSLLTLLVTPFLVNNKDSLYFGIRKFFKTYIPAVEVYIKHRLDFDRSPIDEINLKNHVIVCGYGRIGSMVGRALMLANIPFIAVDYNFHTVQKAKKEGIQIVYGDPTDVDILDYAQAEYASVIVVVVPDKYTQESVVMNARKLNQQILIIGSVRKHDNQQKLKDLGAHVVVNPEFEASLSIIKKIFYVCRLSPEEINAKIRHFKLERGMAV